jgi:hypothetical protein
MVFTQNNDGGIVSLSGFAFQIKVLILYITDLNHGRQVEFETFEDVVENKESVEEDFFDRKSEYFNTIQRDEKGSQAIQVKRTKLTSINLKKVLFNWLLLEERENIDKYILITDSEYNNINELFNIQEENLYTEIIKSNKKSNALITQVKNKFTTIENFRSTYNSIKNKYQFMSKENIDEEISRKLENHFHKHAISELKYILRVKQLMDTITSDIMASIFKKNPYICNKTTFMKHVENICQQINKDEYKPMTFSSFRKREIIDLSDTRIYLSREFIQLNYCEIDKNRIKRHLLSKQYYESYRYNLLLDNSQELIDDLEYKTYDNFCEVKENLKINGKDMPLIRLNKTKEKINSYSYNDDIKAGSCIFLTKSSTQKDMQISWKEEDE